MRKYVYNNKLNVLETRTGGILIIEDIINHYETIADNDTLPEKLRVLIDCKKTKLNVQPNDMNLTQNALKGALKKFVHVKEAILVDQPYETAIAIIFESIGAGSKNYKFKVFCTENAAINWLID